MCSQICAAHPSHNATTTATPISEAEICVLCSGEKHVTHNDDNAAAAVVAPAGRHNAISSATQRRFFVSLFVCWLLLFLNGFQDVVVISRIISVVSEAKMLYLTIASLSS